MAEVTGGGALGAPAAGTAPPVAAPGAAPTSAVDAAVREAGFGLFMTLALVLLAGVVLAGPWAAERTARERLAFHGYANDRLADGNARLRAEIEAAQADPFYVERLARVDLCRRRPGERVLRLPPPAPEPADESLPVFVAQRHWWDHAAERLTDTPRRRLAALLTATLLALIAFTCFANRTRGD
jgi:cell division protein FtsB